jgi:hypothetical protein
MALAGTNGRSFGQVHCGSAQFGDGRRTAHLVSVADQLLRHPQGSFPQKLPNPYDLDAFYHLMAATDLTHASVLDPHPHLTQQQRHVRLRDVLRGTALEIEKRFLEHRRWIDAPLQPAVDVSCVSREG